MYFIIGGILAGFAGLAYGWNQPVVACCSFFALVLGAFSVVDYYFAQKDKWNNRK